MGPGPAWGQAPVVRYSSTGPHVLGVHEVEPLLVGVCEAEAVPAAFLQERLCFTCRNGRGIAIPPAPIDEDRAEVDEL